jgi:hypothetical protein
VELQSIVLSKAKQTQKDKHHISYAESRFKKERHAVEGGLLGKEKRSHGREERGGHYMYEWKCIRHVLSH